MTQKLAKKSAFHSLASLSNRTQANGRYLEVPLARIHPDPEQPRTEFTKASLNELAQSIKANGLLEPLIVREGEAEGDYIVIAGERRRRACALAGLEAAACVLYQGPVDQRSLRVVQLAENDNREDLTMLDRARAYGELVNELGASVAEVAQALGKPSSYVSKHLALLKAEGPALEAVEGGHLESPETYRQFAKLPPRQQGSLLRQAKQRRLPIGRSDVERRAAKKPGARKRRPPAAYSRRFNRPELRILIERLGGSVPSEDEDLAEAFDRVLAELFAELSSK